MPIALGWTHIALRRVSQSRRVFQCGGLWCFGDVDIRRIRHGSGPRRPSYGLQKQRAHSTRHSTRRPEGQLDTNAKSQDRYSHDHEHDDHHHHHSIFKPHVHTSTDNTGFRDALSGKDSAAKITLLGLYSDVALTLAKGIAGYVLHSASLMADAGHSLTDTTAGLITLASLRLSQRGSTPSSGGTLTDTQRKWPYGLGKVETFGGLAMGLMLLGAAGGIGLHSFHLIQALLSSSPSMFAEAHAHGITSLFDHDHDHSHADVTLTHMDHRAVYFALLSIVVKEALYRATKKVGQRLSSPVIIANAQHHRVDALTSGVTLLAITGSYAGLPILDPLGGILVSIMIGRAGWFITSEACQELCDVGISPKVTENIKERLSMLDLAEVQGISYVRGHKSGQYLILDIGLAVSKTMSIEEWTRLDQVVQSKLKTALMPQQVRQIRLQPLST